MIRGSNWKNGSNESALISDNNWIDIYADCIHFYQTINMIIIIIIITTIILFY